jgi:hypothetical protein
LVAIMLGSYPPRSGNEGTDAYLDAIEKALLEEPREVAIDCMDPVHGIVRQCTFIPTVAEIHAWCERMSASMRDIVRREDERIAVAQKAAEDAKQEAGEDLTPEERRAVLDRFWQKLGPNFGKRCAPQEETDEARRERIAAMECETYERQCRRITAEYAQAGLEPVTVGGIPVSRELAKLLKVAPREAVRMEGETAVDESETP